MLGNINLDDFNKNVLQNNFCMHSSEQFLTAKKLDAKMKEAVGFGASKWLVLIILKNKVFRHKRCNGRRKSEMEYSNVLATRVMFLRMMHEIRQTGTAQLCYCNYCNIILFLGSYFHLVTSGLDISLFWFTTNSLNTTALSSCIC
jgi:hypothetical protein